MHSLNLYRYRRFGHNCRLLLIWPRSCVWLDTHNNNADEWRPLTKHFLAMASTREQDTPYNVNDRDTIKTICLIGTALCVCVCAFMCGSHTASSFWWTGKRNIGNTRLSGPCFARERINPIVKWRYLLNFSFVLFFVCFFVVWFISFCNLVQFHHSVL